MELKKYFEEWKQIMLNNIWSRTDISPGIHTDLMFKCQDGSIEAHKARLLPSCPLLYKTVANHAQCPGEMLTVLLPDFSIKIVTKFLEFFYTGSVNCDNAVLQ